MDQSLSPPLRPRAAAGAWKSVLRWAPGHPGHQLPLASRGRHPERPPHSWRRMFATSIARIDTSGRAFSLTPHYCAVMLVQACVRQPNSCPVCNINRIVVSINACLRSVLASQQLPLATLLRAHGLRSASSPIPNSKSTMSTEESKSSGGHPRCVKVQPCLLWPSLCCRLPDTCWCRSSWFAGRIGREQVRYGVLMVMSQWCG